MLDLGENEFKYLNKEEFSRLPRLHTLYLDGNQISAIVDFTFHSAQLLKLSLGSNRIVRIDRYAFYNATIKSLDLSGNKFDSLDKLTFGELRTRDTLRELDLSKSPRLKMSPLIVILGENPQLERLSLAYNDLTELPLDLFELQGNLRELNLSGNSLTELYLHQLSHLHKLQVLDLSHNRIKGLDSSIFLHIDRTATFQDIRLEGNPWHCDLCNIVPLLRWVQNTHLFKDGCMSTPTRSSHTCLRCTAPGNLKGRSILSLEEQSLEWCSNGAEPISILSGVDDPRLGLFVGCALIVIILISAAIYVIARSRWHAAHYYTHEGDRPEIATPPVPPPQDVGPHYPENNGIGGPISVNGGSNGGTNTMYQGHHHPTTNGFDNLIFHNGHHPNGGGSLSPADGPLRDKMIATIEEMTYETQLAYPELAPIQLMPPVIRHPTSASTSSSSPSSRSTPIYCCPGHSYNNNNGNGGDAPSHRSTWNNNTQQQSFRRY